MTRDDDARWMGAALALAARGRGRTAPNPNVGCVVVSAHLPGTGRGTMRSMVEGADAPASADAAAPSTTRSASGPPPRAGEAFGSRVLGRGWTQAGGRPHAEAEALEQAGTLAFGATLYVTLEPCAHTSDRGPACADLIVAAGVARVVAALRDPDARTDGAGFARLRAAGIEVVEGVRAEDAARGMAGFLTRRRFGRPHVTLKLALSLDGAVAMGDGRSRWITGPEARAHAHVERSRHEAILVGRGTYEADAPGLDVRLAGLEDRSPVRVVLSSACPGEGRDPASGDADRQRGPRLRGDKGWIGLNSLDDLGSLPGDHLLVEGGARTAAAFLAADLVDRLLLYRAPILVGGGRTLPDIGLADLADAHGRWRLVDARRLGSDRLDAYERVREP